jgi:hypothetical protein
MMIHGRRVSEDGWNKSPDGKYPVPGVGEGVARPVSIAPAAPLGWVVGSKGPVLTGRWRQRPPCPRVDCRNGRVPPWVDRANGRVPLGDRADGRVRTWVDCGNGGVRTWVDCANGPVPRVDCANGRVPTGSIARTTTIEAVESAFHPEEAVRRVRVSRRSQVVIL